MMVAELASLHSLLNKAEDREKFRQCRTLPLSFLTFASYVCVYHCKKLNSILSTHRMGWIFLELDFCLYADQQSVLSWLHTITALHQMILSGQAVHNHIFFFGYDNHYETGNLVYKFVLRF